MNKQHTIAVLGSHSALDVCLGAKELGFKTLVIVQKGRDKTYSKYYKSNGNLGVVDEVIELDKFKDILNEDVQQELIKRNAIFIPHRSFEVYINDYDAIENKFKIPIFGNKFLLKTEERGVKPNQYDILKKAVIKFPKRFNKPQDIDRLVIVKVLEKERGFERAFFLASSYDDFRRESEQFMKREKITNAALEKAVIEEYVIGVQVNFNFFYSTLHNRLELIGTDTRRQTNFDGILRLPNFEQAEVLKSIKISYEEAGHIAVTVLESLLEQAFDMGERFVKACVEMFPPGVIGPFGLQTEIVPGPPKKEIIVFDVSPRMPGSPGIFSTPYSGYLFRQNISMGKRVAMEIKQAIEKGKVEKIIT